MARSCLNGYCRRTPSLGSAGDARSARWSRHYRSPASLARWCACLSLAGRPVSFRTTDVFLRTFGLTSLAELPPLHEDDVTPMMTERTLAGELAAQAQPGETDGGAE